jgi:hypothetical protein
MSDFVKRLQSRTNAGPPGHKQARISKTRFERRDQRIRIGKKPGISFSLITSEPFILNGI